MKDIVIQEMERIDKGFHYNATQIDKELTVVKIVKNFQFGHLCNFDVEWKCFYR